MKKEIELEEMNVILRIPAEAASVTISAVVIKGDKPVKVKKKLNLKDIHQARSDFLDNVEDGDDYNARFVITEKGRRYLEQLKEAQ